MSEGEGSVKACLQVADEAGDGVSAWARVQVDTHPVVAELDAYPLAYV
jgi:hypothetical protein